MCPGFSVYFIVSLHEALPLLILPSHTGGGGGRRTRGEGEEKGGRGKAERVEKVVN
jgi:hypothetical protein